MQTTKVYGTKSQNTKNFAKKLKHKTFSKFGCLYIIIIIHLVEKFEMEDLNCQQS